MSICDNLSSLMNSYRCQSYFLLPFNWCFYKIATMGSLYKVIILSLIHKVNQFQ